MTWYMPGRSLRYLAPTNVIRNVIAAPMNRNHTLLLMEISMAPRCGGSASVSLPGSTAVSAPGFPSIPYPPSCFLASRSLSLRLRARLVSGPRHPHRGRHVLGYVHPREADQHGHHRPQAKVRRDAEHRRREGQPYHERPGPDHHARRHGTPGEQRDRERRRDEAQDRRPRTVEERPCVVATVNQEQHGRDQNRHAEQPRRVPERQPPVVAHLPSRLLSALYTQPSPATN